MSVGSITSTSRVPVWPVPGIVAVIVDVPAVSGAAHSYAALAEREPGQPLFADQSATRPPTVNLIVSQTPIVFRSSAVPSGACTVALLSMTSGATAGATGGVTTGGVVAGPPGPASPGP